MIRASKRRSAPVRPLHQRLARRYAVQQRLIFGSVAALAVSAVSWLAGLSLSLHLGLTALGLLLGLVWRQKRVDAQAQHWAFRWIEKQTGLSYLTAHELRPDDPSPFARAVRERALRSANQEVPQLQPWALPFLVLAFALALLPHFVVPAWQAPLAALSSPQQAPAPTPPESPPSPTPEATPRLPEARPDTPGVSDRATDRAAEREDGSQTFDTTGPSDVLESAEAEQDALERFLEQQRQQTETGALNVRPAEGDEGESGTPEETTPGGQGNEAQEAEGGEALGGRSNTAEGSETAESQGEAGEQEGSPAQATPSDDEQAAAPDASGADEPQSAQEAGGDEPRDGTTQGGSSEAQEPGSSDALSQEGESSNRAGTAPSPERESSRERLGGNDNPAELLRGSRQNEGPLLRAGQVMQQGQTPNALPQEGSPESYQRAAEEVIREGRIPLEYQNIVRDYFR